MPATAMCLNAGAMGRQDAESETLIPTTGGGFDVPDVGMTLTSGGTGARGRLDPVNTDLVVDHTLRAEHDASEDGSGRGTPIVPVVAGALCRDSFSGGAGGRPEGAAAGHFVPISYSITPSNSNRDYNARVAEKAQAVTTQSGTPQSARGGDVVLEPILPISIQGAATRENPSSGPDGIGVRNDGAAYTLEARQEVQAVAYGFQPRIACNGRGDTGDIAGALNAQSGETGKGDAAPHVAVGMAVRRLTPLECERLQGFPDGHTAIQFRGKPAADGPRYKALGNSMAINVMSWVLGRIYENNTKTAHGGTVQSKKGL